MMDKLTVAIQAGGKSSRMGTDKSFVLFQGRPLIEVVREAVEGLGDELIIVTNKPDDYAHLGLPMVGDLYPETGPLGGIYTALHHATHPHLLTVACDMPWLNRPLLEYMAGLRSTADVIVPRWDKFPEPLHAVYSKRAWSRSARSWRRRCTRSPPSTAAFPCASSTGPRSSASTPTAARSSTSTPPRTWPSNRKKNPQISQMTQIKRIYPQIGQIRQIFKSFL